MTNQVLVLHDVVKNFKKKNVLANVHLEVPEGSIVGISGTNGAGKSVLLRIICGLVKADEGEVRVMGKRIGVDVEFPPRTGALIDAPGFLAQYSARKNLRLLADISRRADRKRVDEALYIVGLDPCDERPVKTYSNGMCKRLGIAQAILEEPRLLILDEPTDAIDQDGWKKVYEYLIALREQGTTVLFSSNNRDEITILCDEAYVLEDGILKPA